MAISKVVYGDDTLMDISEDTVTSENMLRGVTAHGADGEPVVGIANGTWTGTRAQYESEKDSIADGTIVNITDDYEAGGGGGTDSIDITKAEYDALPDSKLSDNKNYFITDWDASGGALTPLEISDVFTDIQHCTIEDWYAYKHSNKMVTINCKIVCSDEWLTTGTTKLATIQSENRPLSPITRISSNGTNTIAVYMIGEEMLIRPFASKMGYPYSCNFEVTYICG